MFAKACLPQDPTMGPFEARTSSPFTSLAVAARVCQRAASSYCLAAIVDASTWPSSYGASLNRRMLRRRGPRPQPRAAGRRPQHPGATAGGRRRRQLQVSGWRGGLDATLLNGRALTYQLPATSHHLYEFLSHVSRHLNLNSGYVQQRGCAPSAGATGSGGSWRRWPRSRRATTPPGSASWRRGRWRCCPCAAASPTSCGPPRLSRWPTIQSAGSGAGAADFVMDVTRA